MAAGFSRIAALAAIVASLYSSNAPAQDFTRAPAQASTTIGARIAAAPQTFAIEGGGSLNMASVDQSCSGFVAAAPNVRLLYTAGVAPLAISLDSAASAALVVNLPDGSWRCAQSGQEGSVMRFDQPHSGRYAIWLAAPGSDTTASGTLRIETLE